MKRKILAIALAGLWVVLSEFIRNELLLKSIWVEHFSGLGLKFQTTPLNGFIWFVWSLVLAYVIFKLLEKFSFRETLLLGWLATFVMMWLAAYNLQVFALELLWLDLPLSLLEIVVAEMIIIKLRK